MRNLTVKQKKMLTDEFNRLVGEGKTVHGTFDMDHAFLEKVDSLNPCEIFYQNADRLITDLVFNSRKKW